MEALRKIGTKMKQLAMDFSDAEMAVHKATNSDPWGPTGTQMSAIADLTKKDYESYREVMGILYSRMIEKPAEGTEQWRHCYKALLICDYLIKHGSPRVIDELRRDTQVLQSLVDYKFKDAKGHDKGINIRQRTEALLELLDDVEAIKEERAKARKNKDKYKGVSSEDMARSGSSRRGFGGSNGSYDDGDSGYDWDKSPRASERKPQTFGDDFDEETVAKPAGDKVKQLNAFYSEDLTRNTANTDSNSNNNKGDDFGAFSDTAFPNSADDFGAFTEGTTNKPENHVPAPLPPAPAISGASQSSSNLKKKLSDTKVTVQLNNGFLAPPSSGASQPPVQASLQPPQKESVAGEDPFGSFSEAPPEKALNDGGDPFGNFAEAPDTVNVSSSVASVPSSAGIEDLFGNNNTSFSSVSAAAPTVTVADHSTKGAIDLGSLYGAPPPPPAAATAPMPTATPGINVSFPPQQMQMPMPMPMQTPMPMPMPMGNNQFQQQMPMAASMPVPASMPPPMGFEQFPQQQQMPMGNNQFSQQTSMPMPMPMPMPTPMGNQFGQQQMAMPMGNQFDQPPMPMPQPEANPTQSKTTAKSSDPFAGIAGF